MKHKSKRYTVLVCKECGLHFRLKNSNYKNKNMPTSCYSCFKKRRYGKLDKIKEQIKKNKKSSCKEDNEIIKIFEATEPKENIGPTPKEIGSYLKK